MDSIKSDIGQSKEYLASHCALQVALQTMKERCLALQQRLTTVEEENSMLRKNQSDNKTNNSVHMDTRTELETLREQVAELKLQKYQLTEHIGMVAMENRQLWSRLSKLTKDNHSLGISLNKIKNTLTEGSIVHQNLIRSKTFTQNAPNPILREKMQHMQIDCKEIDNVSMEEISLDTQQNNIDVNNRTNSTNSMGFGYLNDDSINTILSNDTKKCMDSMSDIRKELLRQQSDLKVALSGLRQRTVLEMCLNCKNQSTKKISTADKNFGTDESHDIFIEPVEHVFNENDAEITEIISENAAFIPIKPEPEHIDIKQQKKIADCKDKICPMCGKIYSNTSSFEMFQDHVESHFIDDTDLDISVEKNFEFISNVGQF